MLEISLLGEQRVALDGSVIAALGAPRSLALVGFLLLHRDAPQRREHIAAQFWPESTDAQARTNLRRELHSLRAGFPQVDTWLMADGGTLLWRPSPDCELDVAALETAAGAAGKGRAARGGRPGQGPRRRGRRHLPAGRGDRRRPVPGRADAGLVRRLDRARARPAA